MGIVVLLVLLALLFGGAGLLVAGRANPRRIRRPVDHQPTSAPMTAGPLIGAPSIWWRASARTNELPLRIGPARSPGSRNTRSWRRQSPVGRTSRPHTRIGPEAVGNEPDLSAAPSPSEDHDR